MSDKISQKPIISKEPKKSTQVKTRQKAKSNQPQIVKSRRKTSLDEFAQSSNLRPEIKAGFKAWLRGKIFQFDEDWITLFEQYKNR